MKIAILGAGKMGSWFAQELGKGNEVMVYSPNPAKLAGLRNAKPMKSLSEISSFAPDLALNAASLEKTVVAFKDLEKLIPDKCIISDIASVKAGLPEYYKESGLRYVSTHPMFGPTFADLNALKGQNAVIISESDAAGKEFFRKFYSSLGLNIFEYSFGEHDKMMAYSLTTPFISSLVFASCVDKTAVPGTTFANHMRIAKGLLSEDDKLLSEVLFNPYSVQQIEKITAKLEFLKHVIKARESGEASRLFGKLRENLGKN